MKKRHTSLLSGIWREIRKIFTKNSQKKCNRSRKKTRPPGFFEKTDSLFSSLLCVIAGQTLLAWRSAPFFLHPFLPLLPPTAPLARCGYNPQDAFCAGPPCGNILCTPSFAPPPLHPLLCTPYFAPLTLHLLLCTLCFARKRQQCCLLLVC